MQTEDRQTFELLLGAERERVKAELESGTPLVATLEEALWCRFQDIEPMTFGEWVRRLDNLERAVLGID